jgi:hypothetical protein
MNTLTATEIIKLLLPLLVIQIGIAIYALVDLSKNGVRNLSKLIWVLIIIFVNMLGPVAFLIFGRGDGSNAKN